MPEEQRKPQVKLPLAVAGFVCVIALIAWISVQIVNLTPNAFSSLASLAQGISNYRESLLIQDDSALTIASDTKLADVGKPITINWNKDRRDGTYTFLYKCLDGVTIDIVDDAGLRNIACDTRYSLGVTDSVTIVVNSEKTRHVDVPYTVAFMRPNDTEPVRTGNDSLTITNPDIEDALASANTPNGEVLGESDEPKEEVVVRPKPATPKPTVVTEPVTEYIYEIPVSNPNGYTDLATRFLNTGDIVNGKFVAGAIERNGSGAFQFEIKNIGTKTSDVWSYTVTLPDGDTYTSPKQTALKPNERAVITLGFDTPDKTSYAFVVVVKVDDKVSSNNNFKQTINFVK
ncbi:MAG: hypothetical protein RLZZ480_676 [Candidatus Parcubacteria bacterium]